jgi:uncharacterized integral membrane protein
VSETPGSTDAEPQEPEPAPSEPPRQSLLARLSHEVREGPEQRRYITLALVALLVLYVVGLIIANAKSVSISFVLGSASISLLWLIILCVGMGMVIGWILRGRWQRGRATKAAAKSQ